MTVSSYHAYKYNQITSYFHPQTSKSITSTNKKKTLSIKSITISSFVANEGSVLFSLLPYKPPLHAYPDNMSRYKMQCIVCSKYTSKADGRCKYVSGHILTETQIHSNSYFNSIRRGIKKHLESNAHLSSISLAQSVSTPSQALYIKIETVYFMIKRTLPWIVFEEIMVYLQRLIDYFGCKLHANCLDIGDKQHSVKEARRIVNIFYDVMKQRIIFIIKTPSKKHANTKKVYFSMAIDGWSRS